jgi:hypothetical protein
MGRVHRGEVRVSRESLEAYWRRSLQQRKPYLENGSWQDYRRPGELRILPHLGHRKLTAFTAPELREMACGAARERPVGAIRSTDMLSVSS